MSTMAKELALLYTFWKSFTRNRFALYDTMCNLMSLCLWTKLVFWNIGPARNRTTSSHRSWFHSNQSWTQVGIRLLFSPTCFIILTHTSRSVRICQKQNHRVWSRLFNGWEEICYSFHRSKGIGE